MEPSLRRQHRPVTESRWILVAAFLFLFSPTVGHAQSAAATPKSGAPAPQTVDARIVQLEAAVKSLTATTTKLNSDQTSISADVREVKDKLFDAGYKALDFSTKLTSMQWQIFTIIIGLLSFVLTFGGVGVYVALRKNLEKDMKEMTRMSRHRIESSSLGKISLAFWQQHDHSTDDSAASLSEKARNLDAAISLARLALDAAEELDDAEPEHESLLAIQTSNLAYYLADMANLIRQKPASFVARAAQAAKAGEVEMALRLARALLPIANKYRDQKGKDVSWTYWMESYCWVLWICGNDAEKKRAKSLVSELYKDERVTEEDLRPWIRKRYFEDKEPPENPA